jgi:hypothetical protein
MESKKLRVRSNFVERKGKLEDLDRSFDLTFWQNQSAKARFQAAWDLILHACRVKGINVRQLRLHRSVETFQRQSR